MLILTGIGENALPIWSSHATKWAQNEWLRQRTWFCSQYIWALIENAKNPKTSTKRQSSMSSHTRLQLNVSKTKTTCAINKLQAKPSNKLQQMTWAKQSAHWEKSCIV